MGSSRLYALVVLAVAILATLMRLARAQGYAEAYYQRLHEPKQRLAQAITGSLALAAGAGLAVIASRQLFPVLFWLGATVAILSGLQMLLALLLKTRTQLLWLVRGIGILFAGITVLIFLLVIR